MAPRLQSSSRTVRRRTGTIPGARPDPQPFAQQGLGCRRLVSRQLNRREIDRVDRHQLVIVAERAAGDVQRFLESLGGLVVAALLAKRSRRGC